MNATPSLRRMATASRILLTIAVLLVAWQLYLLFTAAPVATGNTAATVAPLGNDATTICSSRDGSLHVQANFHGYQSPHLETSATQATTCGSHILTFTTAAAPVTCTLHWASEGGKLTTLSTDATAPETGETLRFSLTLLHQSVENGAEVLYLEARLLSLPMQVSPDGTKSPIPAGARSSSYILRLSANASSAQVLTQP